MPRRIPVFSELVQWFGWDIFLNGSNIGLTLECPLENLVALMFTVGYTNRDEIVQRLVIIQQFMMSRNVQNSLVSSSYSSQTNSLRSGPLTDTPSFTEQTMSTKEQPVSTTEQPVSTTEQPVSTTEQPVSKTEQPVSKRENPVSTTEHPVSTTEQPVSTREHPVSTTEHPVSTREQPVSTRDDERNITLRLMTVLNDCPRIHDGVQEELNYHCRLYDGYKDLERVDEAAKSRESYANTSDENATQNICEIAKQTLTSITYPGEVLHYMHTDGQHRLSDIDQQSEMEDQPGWFTNTLSGMQNIWQNLQQMSQNVEVSDSHENVSGTQTDEASGYDTKEDQAEEKFKNEFIHSQTTVPSYNNLQETLKNSLAEVAEVEEKLIVEEKLTNSENPMKNLEQTNSDLKEMSRITALFQRLASHDRAVSPLLTQTTSCDALPPASKRMSSYKPWTRLPSEHFTDDASQLHALDNKDLVSNDSIKREINVDRSEVPFYQKRRTLSLPLSTLQSIRGNDCLEDTISPVIVKKKLSNWNSESMLELNKNRHNQIPFLQNESLRAPSTVKCESNTDTNEAKIACITSTISSLLFTTPRSGAPDDCSKSLSDTKTSVTSMDMNSSQQRNTIISFEVPEDSCQQFTSYTTADSASVDELSISSEEILFSSDEDEPEERVENVPQPPGGCNSNKSIKNSCEIEAVQKPNDMGSFDFSKNCNNSNTNEWLSAEETEKMPFFEKNLAITTPKTNDAGDKSSVQIFKDFIKSDQREQSIFKREKKDEERVEIFLTKKNNVSRDIGSLKTRPNINQSVTK